MIYVNANWAAFPRDIVESRRPNLVIVEMVERYLARPIAGAYELDRLRSSIAPRADGVEQTEDGQ
jgi:hypothetical protein